MTSEASAAGHTCSNACIHNHCTCVGLLFSLGPLTTSPCGQKVQGWGAASGEEPVLEGGAKLGDGMTCRTSCRKVDQLYSRVEGNIWEKESSQEVL